MAALDSISKHDWDEALTNCDTTIALHAGLPDIYLLRATSKQARGDLEGAAADCQKALQSKPEWPEAYLQRGIVNYAMGNLDSALADYNRALALNPRLTPAPRFIGYAYLGRQDFAAAARALRQACEADPGDDYPHFWLWVACSRLGSIPDADRELSAYLDGRNGKTSDDWPGQLGNFLLGRITEADFLKAAESPDRQKDSQQRCEAWFYAAEKRLSAGDRVTAVAYFEKCVAIHERSHFEYDGAKQELHFLGIATDGVRR
jgi:lipoprotein NlpI